MNFVHSLNPGCPPSSATKHDGRWTARAWPGAGWAMLLVFAGGLLLGVAARPALAQGPQSDAGSSNGWAGPAFLPPVASLVVPGAGQLLMGQRRGWAYLAIEAAGVAFYLDRRSKARADRTRYRDLAWEVARSATGPRIDGTFGYYEQMSEWSRSGRFDRDPDTPGVQPEIDGLSYNGAVWSRAQAIYGVDPENPDLHPDRLESAVVYYQSRAFGEEYLWDWGEEEGARDRFRELIRDSDERFRHATITAGALLANHVFAAGDALVSSRLTTRFTPSAFRADGWDLSVRWAWTP